MKNKGLQLMLKFFSVIIFLCVIMAIITAQSNKKPIEKEQRYFFVAYDIGTPNARSVGNFYIWADTMPSMQYLKELTYSARRCYTPCEYEQVIITSIHEFKDSTEMLKFNGKSQLKGFGIWGCE